MKIIVVGHILEHVSIAREWLIGLIRPTTYSWSDLYTGAKKTRPTGQTGDYFAKIAQSSQKAAPLICLRSRGSGASHNHLRSSLTQERSYHHENREKECQLSFDKDRRKGWEEESVGWNPRPPSHSGKVANSFARSFTSFTIYPSVFSFLLVVSLYTVIKIRDTNEVKEITQFTVRGKWRIKKLHW